MEHAAGISKQESMAKLERVKAGSPLSRKAKMLQDYYDLFQQIESVRRKAVSAHNKAEDANSAKHTLKQQAWVLEDLAIGNESQAQQLIIRMQEKATREGDHKQAERQKISAQIQAEKIQEKRQQNVLEHLGSENGHPTKDKMDRQLEVDAVLQNKRLHHHHKKTKHVNSERQRKQKGKNSRKQAHASRQRQKRRAHRR